MRLQVRKIKAVCSGGQGQGVRFWTEPQGQQTCGERGVKGIHWAVGLSSGKTEFFHFPVGEGPSGARFWTSLGIQVTYVSGQLGT